VGKSNLCDELKKVLGDAVGAKISISKIKSTITSLDNKLNEHRSITEEIIKKEEELLSLSSAESRLDFIIKKNALGPDYAKKAQAICSANYEVAREKGKIDLCERLKRILVAQEYRFTKRARQKGIIPPDLAPTIDEMKTSIDMLYKALEKYRAAGDAK
jgi:hypothetical protein